jgi:hypothetical protein
MHRQRRERALLPRSLDWASGPDRDGPAVEVKLVRTRREALAFPAYKSASAPSGDGSIEDVIDPRPGTARQHRSTKEEALARENSPALLNSSPCVLGVAQWGAVGSSEPCGAMKAHGIWSLLRRFESC